MKADISRLAKQAERESMDAAARRISILIGGKKAVANEQAAA